MKLYPSQEIPLREALSVNPETGLLNYSTVVWGDIKKSAKSSIAAAVGLWRAWQKPWTSIKIIANDLKQADSRVAYYMRRAIELHPEMRHLARITRHSYLITLPNKSTIEAIPIDPSGEAGASGDDMVIYSEIWAWKHTAAIQLWTESTLSPLKYGTSQRWLETYAGYSGESPILEKLYLEGTKEGVLAIPEIPVYVRPASRLFLMWRQKPHLPWQTEAYYAQEASSLTPQEFNRVHRNIWSASLDAFVPAEWWDACEIEPVHYDADEPMVLAADAAVSDDCFAIVGVSGMGDGENYYVRYCHVWYPPKGGKLEYQGKLQEDGKPEIGSPEYEIRRIIEEYNTVELAYDAYQLEDMMGRIKQEMVTHVRAFSQGAPRAIADKGLYDNIRDRRIHHSGDPVLREHILNANRYATENAIRMVQRTELLKIDAAVALSMALERAKALGL